jgi:two-component system NtrC family response regulator
MKEPLVLIVDDDEDFRRYSQSVLESGELRLITGGGVAEGRELISRYHPDILLADLELPDGKGLDLLPAAGEEEQPPVVTIITGKGTVQSAVKAMKQGAFDYLLKPVSPMELRAHVQKALSHHRLIQENRSLRSRLDSQQLRQEIIGRSEGIRTVLRMIEKVAPHEATVLITGESGTGKELVARAVHQRSRRSGGPFVAVNCSALPEHLLESELFGHERGAFTGAVSSRKGLFVQADGGTLFLDEIGTMPVGLQAKLLRVLEEREIRPVGSEQNIQVDVRVIAATNAKLKVLLEKGQFREDLFYRLNVVLIPLPPLRKRREDIGILARHFLAGFSPEDSPARLSPKALKALEQYSWPGNIRELSNAMERASLLSEQGLITPDMLPEEVRTGVSPVFAKKNSEGANTLAESEKAQIEQVLEECDWNRTQAAQQLGISRRTLYNKLRQYRIKPPVGK